LPPRPATSAPVSADSPTEALDRAGVASLARRSDWVVHADIASRSSRWVDGNIETTYQVVVRESLLGEGPETFNLTLPGGEAPNGAPIAQYVRGTPEFADGEEVVLFLRRDFTEDWAAIDEARRQVGLEPFRFHPDSGLATSPRIVGR